VRRGEVWWGEAPRHERRLYLVLNFDNLIMMPPSQLTERITSLGIERMSEVCAALAAVVDC